MSGNLAEDPNMSHTDTQTPPSTRTLDAQRTAEDHKLHVSCSLRTADCCGVISKTKHGSRERHNASKSLLHLTGFF